MLTEKFLSFTVQPGNFSLVPGPHRHDPHPVDRSELREAARLLSVSYYNAIDFSDRYTLRSLRWNCILLNSNTSLCCCTGWCVIECRWGSSCKCIKRSCPTSTGSKCSPMHTCWLSKSAAARSCRGLAVPERRPGAHHRAQWYGRRARAIQDNGRSLPTRPSE
jgi:hypothetical protein